MNMRIRILATLVLSLLLAACAGPKPLFTDADVAAAERSGTLPSLYNQVQAQMVGKQRTRKKDAPAFAQLDSLGRKLGAEMNADLRKKIEDARMKNDIVPLDVLDSARSTADPMKTWDPSRYDALIKDINRETSITQKAIRDVQAYIERLPGEAYKKGMDALYQLELLSGDTRYRDKREAVLRTARAEFDQAVATDEFDRALLLLDELPVDKQTEHTRVELQTRRFETKFNEALAEDKPDDAYHLFETLSVSPYFNDVRARLGPTGLDMANYFVALASNAVVAGNMADAWRWFGQARYIRGKLGVEQGALPEEKPFVDRMYRGFDAAKKDNLWGLALGYIYIVQTFDPSWPSVATDLRDAELVVGKTAIKTATTAPFSSAAGNTDYSGTIGTKITEYLFQTVPNDVRILVGTGSAADLIISGSVDESRVERSTEQTRKTARVVTDSKVMVRNPKYDQWLKLPERDRRQVPQPAAMIPTEKQEDVSYNVVQHRKVGYFSVAFRVVEAATGKVLHTDSVTMKREFTDESNEGVELGEFSLPAKAASLPTDIEILNQLASEASQEIGKRLAERIGGLEKQYAAAGKQAVVNGNLIEAAQNYANAVLVAQRKNIDQQPFRTELMRAASGSGYTR